VLGDEGSVLRPVWLFGPGVPVDPLVAAGAEARGATFGDVFPGILFAIQLFDSLVQNVIHLEVNFSDWLLRNKKMSNHTFVSYKKSVPD
jgi:hypothetical protein